VDDTIYGGGAGMLIQAEPVIQAIEQALATVGEHETYLIVFPSPSESVFDQSHALQRSSYDHIIWINGRYEGIDHRVQLWCEREHGERFIRLSLGSFVLLGGEVATMTMVEAVSRLVP
jgi:tRNA (guanine37-N1)-methyltransferase